METQVEGEGAVASEPVVEDRWETAEEAFDAAVPEKQEVEEVEKPESQVEPEIPDYLKLDDLRVPGKYKEAVKERIEKVVKELEGKYTPVEQELGQHKEAVEALVGMFKEVAQTPREQIPAKVADLIEQFGGQIGLDPSAAAQLRTVQQQQQEQQAEYTIQDINQHFLDKMVSTEDPKEFRALWEQADLLKSQVMERQMMNKVGLLFKAYHDKYIAPDKQTLEEYKTKSQKEAEAQELQTKKTSWNSAKDSLKGKYQDWDKYESKIREAITADEDLQAGRNLLNQQPDNVEGRTKFLERLYLAISRGDAIENVKRPSQGGLPPSRHINTKKSGGGNWESAYENTKELWE